MSFYSFFLEKRWTVSHPFDIKLKMNQFSRMSLHMYANFKDIGRKCEELFAFENLGFKKAPSIKQSKTKSNLR